MDDVAELRDSFEQVQAQWAVTIERARRLSEEAWWHNGFTSRDLATLDGEVHPA